jgi:hypothetical protein
MGAVQREMVQRGFEVSILIDSILGTQPGDDYDPDGEEHSVGFFRDEVGLWVGTYVVRSLLREAATLAYDGKLPRGMKQCMMNLWEIESLDDDEWPQSHRLYLWRDGTPLREPDEIVRREDQVTLATGPKTYIRHYECVRNVRLRFRLKTALLDTGMSDEDMATVLSHAPSVKMGAQRARGYGHFTIEQLRGAE